MATTKQHKRKRNQMLKGPHGGMQLVLTEDVQHLGKQGDVVEVRPGYGRNYLLPRGMATIPTEHNLRLLERYKSGGYNINPREIELAIEEHPSVAQAAVVGVPDALYQEVGCAFVVAKANKPLAYDELRDWCRVRMANYKVPKHFHVRAELPLLPIGKVDKRALKTMHVAHTPELG